MSTHTSLRRRRARLFLAGLGGLAVLLGVVTALSPAADASLRTAVALVGNDYFLVAILGVLALLVLLAVLIARGRTGIDQATPPAPEAVYQAPRFGEEFDEFVADTGFRGLASTNRHREVRDRFRTVAVTTVMRDANCTQAEARERVESGTWTDDDVAASFLAESATPGLGARLRAAFRGTSPFSAAARRTAAEIARRDAEARR